MSIVQHKLSFPCPKKAQNIQPYPVAVLETPASYSKTTQRRKIHKTRNLIHSHYTLSSMRPTKAEHGEKKNQRRAAEKQNPDGPELWGARNEMVPWKTVASSWVAGAAGGSGRAERGPTTAASVSCGEEGRQRRASEEERRRVRETGKEADVRRKKICFSFCFSDLFFIFYFNFNSIPPSLIHFEK